MSTDDWQPRDPARLAWMLAQFHICDNAWMASFCFSANKDGIRAEIDKAMNANKLTNSG